MPNTTIGADALRAALAEAQAGLEFAAARLPAQEGDFVPTHLAALEIVNAALASAAQPADAITAGEAVFAFAAWLTCRDEAVTLGSAHDAAGAAELVGAFVASQGLAQPRDDYHLRLRPYPAPTPQAAPDPRTPADMRVNGGALILALNVLRRAGKNEVADELEKTAVPVAQGEALVALIEHYGRVEFQRYRVGHDENSTRWDIELGHCDLTVSGATLPVAIAAAIASTSYVVGPTQGG